MTTLYAAAKALGACARDLDAIRAAGAAGVPATLAGWRAARAAGLAGDPLEWTVRVLPVEALAVLAEDDLPRVRWAVAQHRACPLALLRALAEDPDWRVRRTVALHPACPPAVLWELTADADWGTRKVAYLRLADGR